MKRYYIIFIIFLLCCSASYAQLKENQLKETIKLTVKDLLDLRLQILAAQMTSGSYKIWDMGRLGFPVSIRIDENLKIVYEIEGNLPSNLSKDAQRDVMKNECMMFVEVGICDLIERYFDKLDFNADRDLIGFWYFVEGSVPRAKMENGNFYWLEE